MIVHFTCSKRLLAENSDTLRRVVRAIKRRHELASNWIDDYARTKNKGDAYDFDEAHRKSIEELAKADVFIAEVTHSSFGVGYQAAVAIQQKKPMLLLSREDASNDSMVRGLDKALVRYRAYTEDSLGQIIESFLDDNDVQAKDLRFNFFLDRQIYNYLRWASFRTGKTKASILRELVQKEIRQNETYRKAS